jgi:hypothetical protein
MPWLERIAWYLAALDPNESSGSVIFSGIWSAFFDEKIPNNDEAPLM